MRLRRTLGLQRLSLELSSAMGRSMTKVALMMKDEGTLALTGAKLKRKGLFLANMDFDRLAVRTGTLRKTLTSSAFVSGNKYVSVFGSTAPQLPLLEQGGTVKATRSKALLIPTVNVMTPTGRMRDRWASLMSQGSLRDAGKREGIFVLKNKRRGTTGWLAQREYKQGMPKAVRGRGGRMKSTANVKLLFLMRREVNVPGRRMLRKALQRKMLPQARAIVGREIEGGVVMAASGGH